MGTKARSHSEREGKMGGGERAVGQPLRQHTADTAHELGGDVSHFLVSALCVILISAAQGFIRIHPEESENKVCRMQRLQTV